MIDLDKAMTDPASFFSMPADVCEAAGLSREQKVDLLRRWEYDARELQVAEEENMAGGTTPWTLEDVLEALHRLGAEPHHGAYSPTKQGGE